MIKNHLIGDHDMSAYVPSVRTAEYVEFPKWKVSASGQSVIVQNADEEAALEGAWFDSKAEADAKANTLSDVQIAFDALVTQATQLGIKVDKRWSADRLRQEIETAQKKE
jgi:hypothetical protein